MSTSRIFDVPDDQSGGTEPGGTRDPPPGGNGTRAPTYVEQIALDSYKTAAESALSDATSFGDKVVTAAVSIGTAYWNSPRAGRNCLSMATALRRVVPRRPRLLWADAAGRNRATALPPSRNTGRRLVRSARRHEGVLLRRNPAVGNVATRTLGA